ncbi:MAG: sel1 repeat family protein, partial [Methylococcaceae bacterium]
MEIVEKEKWEKLLALAENGDAEAQWEVGYYYEEGAVDKLDNLLVEKNPLKAFDLYTLLAKQGNQDAQISLSNFLSTGEYIEQDYEAAIYWAKEAIKQGNSGAAKNLGTIYRDLRKPAMAFRCYQQAVTMGDTDALFDMGICY